jgi:cobalt-zinc-cadmium efflux system membrane fusion protein
LKMSHSLERLQRRGKLVLPALLIVVTSSLCGCGSSERRAAENDSTSSGSKYAVAESNKANQPAEITLTSEAVNKYAIKTEHAESQAFTPIFVAPGEVSFDTDRISQVGSAVPGRVVELLVRVGDKVNKGDGLVVVDSPELGTAQSDYLQKRVAVGVATPAVGLARSAYDRAKRLAQSENITLSELQRREGELKAGEGNLQMADSALSASLNRLRLLGMDDQAIADLEGDGKIDCKFIIRAPMSGQIVERAMTLGQLVSPDKDSLITIIDLSTVWVLADVPQSRLMDVTIGAAARVISDDQSDVREGTVSFIPPQLDSSTRSASVRIVVKNDSGSLRAGIFCKVEIATSKSLLAAKSVVLIPQEAVQNIDGTPSVFVPVDGKSDTFMAKSITIGPAAGGKVTVEEGLSPGQPFVSSGTFVLKAEPGKSTIEEYAAHLEETDMKEIKAIIQQHMLPRVMNALHAVPHFPGATVSDCQDQGRGWGPSSHYEATEASIFLAKKVKLEMFSSDDVCDALVRVIQSNAHTGNPGDGVIMVVDLDRVVRIRTAEEQDDAV